MINAPQQIDSNHKVINSNESIQLESIWTFAAATTGAATTHTLFTVTGNVLANVWGICSVDVTGSGTGAVGTANNTQAFIATTTGTAIDAGEVWQNATPTAEVGAALGNAKPVANGADIILTIATDTFTAGVIAFYCQWRPLNNTSRITATTPA